MNKIIFMAVVFSLILVSNLAHASNPEVNCLAQNIYYEAGAESFDGKVAVAQVTINRVNHQKYPKTVCGVVKQRHNSTCQFSWVCEARKKINKESENWQESVYIAKKVLTGDLQSYKISEDALFFHTKQLPFRWTYKYQKEATIGNHIFYKHKRKQT